MMECPIVKSEQFPKLSNRSSALGTENAFVVLAEVTALQRAGSDIISFCIGQPDFPTPVNIQDAAIKAIRDGKHGYTPSNGIPELREAIAKEVNRLRGLTGPKSVSADDVVVGSGAKPFIAYAILSTTDFGVGDEVIYPNPGFPIYESQIVANGAVPVPLGLKEARNFAFDPAELEAAITPRTRMLILNTPHHPTGGSLSAQDLADIAAIMRKHPQVWIYADEIYSRLIYPSDSASGSGVFQSIAALPDMQERTIISDGASKTWAMTGWRIGYAVNKTLAPTFTRWVTNTESCASHISQWAAVEALNGPQDAADMMKASFQKRRDLIVGLLNQVPGIHCLVPGGAFYAWPNVTEACRMTGCADSEVFRKKLLTEAGVAVLADIHFGARVAGEGQHIRFSYAASEKAIQDGVGRIADWVKKNTK